VSAIRKGYALPESPEPAQETLDLSPISDAPQEGETKPPTPPPPPDQAAEELWGRLLEHAGGEIDASSLRVWFEAVTAVSLDTDSLTISVPTPFAKEYIETRFKATLEDALRQELSPPGSNDAALHIVVGAGG
jgi:hypothetical protein